MSAPYLEAKRALVLPAGIPVRIRETPLSIGSKPRIFIKIRAMSGKAKSRTKAR